MARSTSKRAQLAIVLAVVALGVIVSARLAGERAWRRALREAGFAGELAPPGPGSRVLIVAPHPDDEALGCGGLIQQARANGATVSVALMTNGDASEWATLLGERQLRLSSDAFLRLGRERQQESLTALEFLGVAAGDVYFLGFPNGGLVPMWRPEHWGYEDTYRSEHTGAAAVPYELAFIPEAPYCGREVVSSFIQLLEHLEPDMVFVTHPRDVHPDHWATYTFTRYALATIAVRGNDWARKAKVYGYLVHYPRYPVPKGKSRGLEMRPPVELAGPASRWLTLPLQPEQARRKEDAVRRYRSQEPRFDRLLRSLVRANETFEELPILQVGPDQEIAWHSPDRRAKLKGVEVEEVVLSKLGGPDAHVRVSCAPQPQPPGAYVCFDVRSWDDNRAPVIVTVYLSPVGTSIRAIRPGPADKGPPVQVLGPLDGLYEIRGNMLAPGNPAPRDIFVSCWGSIRDQITDPAAISWVTVENR